MGELRNRRHEAFAKELARGQNATAAYSAAGYRACRQNASRLASFDDIKIRVEELKEQRATELKSNRDPTTGQFLQGASGNPKGRPKGNRNKLSEEFIGDLHAEWQTSGPASLQRVAAMDPVAFVKVVASVIPAKLDSTLNVEFSAAQSFIEAFRLARRRVADADDPILLDLEAVNVGDE